MGLGDIYEASVIQDSNGEEMINVFHFEHLEATGGAFDLITRIINQWITANWDTLVSLGVSFIEIAARNLFNPSDAALAPVGVAGTAVGEEMPVHDAIQVTFETDDPSFRQGRKSFGGITEGYGNAGILSAGTASAWQDFVDAELTQPLIGTPNERYQYVIVKRVKESDGQGGFTYRLPENVGEAVFSQVISGVVNPFMRTQVSRNPQE